MWGIKSLVTQTTTKGRKDKILFDSYAAPLSEFCSFNPELNPVKYTAYHPVSVDLGFSTDDSDCFRLYLWIHR